MGRMGVGNGGKVVVLGSGGVDLGWGIGVGLYGCLLCTIRLDTRYPRDRIRKDPQQAEQELDAPELDPPPFLVGRESGKHSTALGRDKRE